MDLAGRIGQLLWRRYTSNILYTGTLYVSCRDGIFAIECATRSDCFRVFSPFRVFFKTVLGCNCEALDLLRGPFPHEEAASPARCGTVLKSSNRLGSSRITSMVPVARNLSRFWEGVAQGFCRRFWGL